MLAHIAETGTVCLDYVPAVVRITRILKAFVKFAQLSESQVRGMCASSLVSSRGGQRFVSFSQNCTFEAFIWKFQENRIE